MSLRVIVCTGIRNVSFSNVIGVAYIQMTHLDARIVLFGRYK
jgi:hypothetical protein